MGAIAVALLWAAIAVGGGDRSDEGRAAAFTACTRYVKAVVVDPGAADFPPPSSATITHDGDRYTVRAYVDSEDAAGASTRTTFTCEVGGDRKSVV